MDVNKCPAHILRDIFFKMGNTEIVRMRRTCSAMNTLIDENKEKLSSRAEIGLHLAATIYRRQPDRIIVARGKTVLEYGDDLSSMISGVAIRNFSLHIKMKPTTIEEVRQLDDDFTRKLSLRLFELTKTLKISCDTLQLHTLSARVAVQIADHVAARKNTFFDYNGIEILDYFDVLSKNKKCSSYSMSFRGIPFLPGLFEKAKYIPKIYAHPFKYTKFRDFLWEICRSSDHGNFCELHALLDTMLERAEYFVFDDPEHPMPAFQTIWDKSTAPKELSNMSKMPDFVRIFHQTANIIVLFEERYEKGVEVIVYIARKKEQFLLYLTKEFFDLEIKLPDDFITSTEEEQAIVFRHAVLAAHFR